MEREERREEWKDKKELVLIPYCAGITTFGY